MFPFVSESRKLNIPIGSERMKHLETDNEKPGQNSEIYTVAKVAELLGLTKQYVNRCIKDLNLDVARQGNKTILTAEQADELASYFCSAPISSLAEPAKEQDSRNDSPLLDSVLSVLQKQLEEKDRQLAEKDKQIERLQSQVDSLIETNSALSATNAAKQVAETKEILLLDKEKPKQGFWSRLFG